jgi:hypothetical protein
MVGAVAPVVWHVAIPALCGYPIFNTPAAATSIEDSVSTILDTSFIA